MKHALVRTSSLLSPKLSCTNPFDKTCIDNTELKIEIKNIAIDRKTDGMAVASLASATLVVSNYFDPKYLLLYYSSNTITIDKEATQPTFFYVASTSFDCDSSNSKHRYYVKSFLLRIYFENAAKCGKKAVTAALLEGQPC